MGVGCCGESPGGDERGKLCFLGDFPSDLPLRLNVGIPNTSWFKIKSFHNSLDNKVA